MPQFNTRQKNDPKPSKKRSVVSFLVSIGLHGMLVMLVTAFGSPAQRAPSSKPVEIELVSQDMPKPKVDQDPAIADETAKEEPVEASPLKEPPAALKPVRARRISQSDKPPANAEDKKPPAQVDKAVAAVDMAPIHAPKESDAIEPESDRKNRAEDTPKLSLEELKLGWSDFEAALGEQAGADRRRNEQDKLSRRRRSGAFVNISPQVERALQNNIGWIAPGRTKPLGELRAEFSSYIATMNKRVTPHFERFLHAVGSPMEKMHAKAVPHNPFYAPPPDADLKDSARSTPLPELSLRVTTEIEMLASGEVSEVRVIRTSGNATFDAAAVSSVLRASPYPPPPPEILSYNERLYLRWKFHRRQGRNGPDSAEPFLLTPPKNPAANKSF